MTLVYSLITGACLLAFLWIGRQGKVYQQYEAANRNRDGQVIFPNVAASVAHNKAKANNRLFGKVFLVLAWLALMKIVL